jgi:hypothetical protein
MHAWKHATVKTFISNKQKSSKHGFRKFDTSNKVEQSRTMLECRMGLLKQYTFLLEQTKK